jgi:hypothetical protein
MMVVFLLWSRNELADTRAQGWLEAVRKSNFDELVAAHTPGGETGNTSETDGSGEPARASSAAGIDDDEHLAAYNAYLARLNQPGRGADGRR